MYYFLKENSSLNYELYSIQDAQDAGELSMYKIESKVHLYDHGVKSLLHISKDTLNKLSKKVKLNSKSPRCYNHDSTRSMTIARALSCGDFSYIKRRSRSCQNLLKQEKYEKAYKCIAQYISYFTTYVDAKSLVSVVGKENIYIEGRINGFRKKHEYLYRPIFAGSEGRQNSIYKRGPFESIQRFLGVSKGEFYGNWYRERL